MGTRMGPNSAQVCRICGKCLVSILLQSMSSLFSHMHNDCTMFLSAVARYAIIIHSISFQLALTLILSSEHFNLVTSTHHKPQTPTTTFPVTLVTLLVHLHCIQYGFFYTAETKSRFYDCFEEHLHSVYKYDLKQLI